MPDEQNAEQLLDTRPDSVGAMFFERVEATPDLEAYSLAVAGTDDWQQVTWRETGEHVTKLAAGLMSLGVEPEQRVAIASGTRYEWILADLAVMSAGAATTTVYPSTMVDDVAFIVGDSGSVVVFAEDTAQVDKLRSRRDDLPGVRQVVVFDGSGDADWVIGLDELETMGEEYLAAHPTAVSDRVAATRGEQLATLIYTSGTTGRPKGVRLRHSSWTYEGTAVDALRILSPDDRQFLWLPLAHSFGKVLLTAQLAVGFPTSVDGRVEKIVENLAIVKPTFMGAAPRIFEKAHARIQTMMADEGGLKKAMFDRAFAVGCRHTRLTLAGQQVPFHLAVQQKLFDRLVFAKIRQRFGGRVRFFVSGSAALNRDIAEWFHAAGIVILEGYGLTESSAGTCLNLPHHIKLGTIGLPFPGTEAKIAEDGELLLRGPGVMDGYHNLDHETSESMRNGWLHTGDIGQIDDDGFITINDRKKDLFKTSGGKYVAPQIIEGRFKALCPYASQFMVHGNERNFVSAIVTLDEEAIMDWAQKNGLGGKSYADVVTSTAAHAMVQGYIDELNTKLNRWETIKRFVIPDRDLSVDEGEITPSMKVKRKVVEEHYREQLDELYR